MQELMGAASALALDTARVVLESLAHNWLPLALAIGIAAVMKVHVDPTRLQRILGRNRDVSILGSVVFGAFTPLCACGTMAVVLGALSATVPWAPIMAFLTSSPLMSPDGFVLLAGILGLPFAVAVAVSSLVIGTGAGYLTHLVETRTGFLRGQTRFGGRPAAACGCSTPPAPVPAQETAAVAPPQLEAAACGCSAVAPALPMEAAACGCAAAVPALPMEATGCGCSGAPRQHPLRSALGALRLPETWRALREVGAAQILFFYCLFVAIGSLVNRFVPTEMVRAVFGSTSFSIPLAALVGLPVYVTTESSIPLVQALMRDGADPGAMLAFMITGPATSAWVVAGLATFLRARAIAYYVALVFAGGVLSGYGYQLYLAAQG